MITKVKGKNVGTLSQKQSLNKFYAQCTENGKEFICTLPIEKQKKIRNELIKLKEAIWEIDIDEVMNGRLCDLEDDIDWRNIFQFG